MVLANYDKNYLNVNDPGVLMDVDTPEDYQEAMAYFKTKMAYTTYWWQK